jgi:hypothetical protein
MGGMTLVEVLNAIPESLTSSFDLAQDTWVSSGKFKRAKAP